MICGECGGREYEGYDGPNSDIGRCTCHQPDSIDEFEEPLGGMYHPPRRERFGSFPLPQHQAPSFQPRSSTSDTMPLALGIGIGVILGAVICLGFVIVF